MDMTEQAARPICFGHKKTASSEGRAVSFEVSLTSYQIVYLVDP